MKILCIGEAMVEMAPAERDGDYTMGFAGDTFNTAWHMAQRDPTADLSYFTCLGTDALSERMLTFFEASRVSTQYIRRLPDRHPGLYLISLSHGERSFTYYRQHAAARLLADDLDRLATAACASDLVFFSGITLAILPPEKRQPFLDTLAHNARRLAFDPNYRPALWTNQSEAQRGLMAGAAIAQIVLPSFDDEQALFNATTIDQTIARYQALGCEELVIKNGAAPTTVAQQGTAPLSRAPRPVQPVDTTGAGDSFNAAYLLARLRNAPIDTALQEAHALSAEVIAGKGALFTYARDPRADLSVANRTST